MRAMKRAALFVLAVACGLAAPPAGAEEEVTLILLGGPADDRLEISVSDDGTFYEITSLTPLEVGGKVCEHPDGDPLQLRCNAPAIGGFEIRTDEGDDLVGIRDVVLVPVTLDGGSGNDRLIGGAADDWLLGGPGRDLSIGGGGADRIDGGEGPDSIGGGHGNDQLSGGGGLDSLYGNGGDDRIQGGFGPDVLSGGMGRDLLRGEQDRDYLAGGVGDDALIGGPGPDRLRGGEGIDFAMGGPGNDDVEAEKIRE